VDLVPDARGGWTIIELNGAVEFNCDYALDADVFASVAGALIRSAEVVAAVAPDELELPLGYQPGGATT
jgi:hypothetical protein